jgi:poly(A) polymerase
MGLDYVYERGSTDTAGGELTDSAVRRYVTDARPLLARLHDAEQGEGAAAGRGLRRPRGAHQRARRAEELDRIRPDLNGDQIMAILGIPPSPVVSQAWAY